MKIEKKTINSKTRKLSANYTMEVSQDIESYFGDELEKLITEEINNEIMHWHCVMLHSLIQDRLSDDWCKQHLKDEYRCYGHYWYFKLESDATMFALTWT
jgi:hypothetical protein